MYPYHDARACTVLQLPFDELVVMPLLPLWVCARVSTLLVRGTGAVLPCCSVHVERRHAAHDVHHALRCPCQDG